MIQIKLRSLVRNLHSGSAIWVILGTAGSALTTIIGFKIIGELLGAKNFGQSILVYGFILLISNITAGPISQAVSKFFFDCKTKLDRSKLFFSGAALICLSYCLIVPLGTLIFFLFIKSSAITAIMLSIGLACEMIRPFCNCWLQSEGKFAKLALSQLADSALRPLFVYLLIGTKYLSGYEIILCSYALSAFLSVYLLCNRNWNQLIWTFPHKSEMKKILKYCTPLVGNGLFGWLTSTGDRYLIGFTLGPSAAGIYIAASALGGRLSVMSANVFETYYRPKLYSAAAENNINSLLVICKKWGKEYFFFGIIVLLSLTVSLSMIQNYLLPKDFRNGSGAVIIVSFIAYWIIGIGFIPQRINYAFEQTTKVAIVEILGMIFMLASVLIFGHCWGLTGASMGLLIAGLVRTTLAAKFAHTSINQHHGRNH